MSPGGSPRIKAAMEPRRPGAVGTIEKATDAALALKRLRSYLSPHRGALALVLVCIVLSIGAGLLGPFLMGQAIDRHIAVRVAAGLPGIALFMLAAFLVNNLCQAVADWVMAEVSQKALGSLRQDLFSHMQGLPIRFFDSRPAGELMSRLTSDMDAVNQAISQNVTSLFASTLSLAGIIVTMFALDFWLALASLVVVPVMFWFTGFVARSTRKGFRTLQARLGHLNGIAEEALSGQKVIKAFGRKETVLADFRARNQAVYEAGVQANTYALLLMPITGVLGNFFVIVLAGLGGWLALNGRVSVGTIATFIIYAQNFINPLRQLANLYNAIQSALAGAERIFNILDTPPEIDGARGLAPRSPVAGRIRFDHVGFAYEPGHPVIRDMDLEALAGQTIALVGATGAGKTTIINLLTRFYEIDGGRISLDSRDIRQIGKAGLRRCFGLVLQDTFLFAGTVMDNLRYGNLAASDEACMAAARVADADHFIRLLPQGYQTLLSERACNLSQGQRQLLSIARAILAEPDILILDEATSNVDTRTEIRIQKGLGHLMKHRTTFVIAHRLSTIRHADQVLVIQDGRVVEQGTHHSLLACQGLYHHLYLSQFKGQAI